MNTLLPQAAHPGQALIERIAAPLPSGPACGGPLRFDPVFTEIRLLREEDDPSLPMGQWERPLRQADWDGIAARCIELLCTRSKHLQLAAWLTEAWTRQHGVAGLSQGLCVLDALLERYWEQLHPLIEEDGDADLRTAPLEWLNEALALAVHVHMPLLRLADMKPATLTLAQWERMTAQELAEAAPDAHGAGMPPAPGRAEVLERAAQSPEAVLATGAALRRSLALVAAIEDGLRQRLPAPAPNLARLAARLEAAARVLAQLGGRHPAASATPPTAAAAAAAPAADGKAASGVRAADAAPAPPAMPPAPEPVLAGWRNRAQAYATLDALAAYLSEVEPHSPVPFLIRRAVHWGSMPLPELIADLIREEGDLNRLVGFLGIRR